ncbi:hypothetical protein AB3X96_39790 [Paraburkholderia sp. BR13439]|uniref:hypothetical protein n=1 Tax=Paraburkholderia sp. BR13439 TaxID=3236996 RepID=UPI0034CFB57D
MRLTNLLKRATGRTQNEQTSNQPGKKSRIGGDAEHGLPPGMPGPTSEKTGWSGTRPAISAPASGAVRRPFTANEIRFAQAALHEMLSVDGKKDVYRWLEAVARKNNLPSLKAMVTLYGDSTDPAKAIKRNDKWAQFRHQFASERAQEIPNAFAIAAVERAFPGMITKGLLHNKGELKRQIKVRHDLYVADRTDSKTFGLARDFLAKLLDTEDSHQRTAVAIDNALPLVSLPKKIVYLWAEASQPVSSPGPGTSTGRRPNRPPLAPRHKITR